MLEVTARAREWEHEATSKEWRETKRRARPAPANRSRCDLVQPIFSWQGDWRKGVQQSISKSCNNPFTTRFSLGFLLDRARRERLPSPKSLPSSLANLQLSTAIRFNPPQLNLDPQHHRTQFRPQTCSPALSEKPRSLATKRGRRRQRLQWGTGGVRSGSGKEGLWVCAR